MAGDWIKMRNDLADDPAVVLVAGILDISEDEIVGKLHRLWSWADKHTTDGTAPAITPKWVDRYVGAQGFAAALQRAGWLCFTEDGIEVPHFSRHNGESAKKRADATVRKRLSRENRDAGETGVTRLSVPRPFARHVLIRDNFTCVYCGTASDAKTEGTNRGILSVDHLVPITRGGSGAVPNLACACRACNGEKNDRTPEEWGRLPKFLQVGVTYSQVTGLSHKTSDKTETREEKRRSKTTSLSSTRQKSPKGSKRCPEEFAVTAAMVGWAKTNAPGVDIPRETVKLRNHEFVKPKSDWPATWQNWILEAGERMRGRGTDGSAGSFRERDAELAISEAEKWGGGRVAARRTPVPLETIEMEPSHGRLDHG
jgi:hypothetical protein